ncbi:uncharacterized protein mus304 [Palaemon carinicauda]|uniref:uncharacterized protein mus304 n=1 Tax=Palaemon carinicauda TaxID=392227 RepID=UPI0035B5CC6C
MPWQQGSSGFPSMAGFLGENPAKRLRMQEPQKEKTLTDMNSNTAQEEDDDVWEELDEDVMEECMVLATQMCTVDMHGESTKGNNVNPFSETFNMSKRNENGELLEDSGFSSAKGTAHETSKAFIRSSKGKSSDHLAHKSTKGNAYTSRFNDFASTSDSQKLAATKAYQNSGRVYNSIPVKGNNVNRGAPVAQAGTSRDTYRIESENVSKWTDSDVAKLQDEIMLKHGEISMLRSELKRKETALAAERLERYSIVDQAEKKGREKAALATVEAENKIKQYNKIIEKLQDELHFKNREIEELESQCRRLEKQTQQQSFSPSQKSRKELLAVKRSPVKPSSSFKTHFDFSTSVGKRNIGAQTELLRDSKQRPKLVVTNPKGRARLSRQMVCLFSSDALETYSKSSSHSGRWVLNNEWQNVLSKMSLDYEDSDSVQNQLIVLSIKRLEEVHTMFASEKVDGSKSPPTNFDPVDSYEGLVVPALAILKSLTTIQCMNLLQKAIEVVCLHLIRISYRDMIINDHTWPLTLQALSQLSRIITPLDKTVCIMLSEKLTAFCKDNCYSEKLMALLQVLQDLSHHKHFTENLCTNEGDCCIDALCTLINQQQEEHLLIAVAVQEWLSELIRDAPPWLISKCSCPSKLLAVLLKEIYHAVDTIIFTQDQIDNNLRRLLIPTIRLLHSWSTKDSCWWEKIGCLPQYTVIMGVVINNAKRLKADRQTVDLLCDLYEFDDKIFESC